MFGWLVAGSLALGAPALKDRPAPADLCGDWEIEGTEEEGKLFPPDAPAVRFRFHRDGTYQVFRGGKEVAGRRGFASDPKASPPTLDYNTPPDGPALPCIYRIDGDRLTVCRAGPDQPRPTELAAPAGSGLLVVRMRRVPPAD